MGKPEVSAVHVYFHRDELEVLRRIGAANDQSVRAVVRMIVRDFLAQNQAPRVTWTMNTWPPGVAP